MLEKKRTKSQENEIYAKNNNLKSLKKEHNGAPQTSNFNKYIKFHKEYISYAEELKSLIEENNKKSIREFHDRMRFIIYFDSVGYKFPNLYHYASEQIKKNIEKLYQEAYNVLPYYGFKVTDSRYSNDIQSFKTSDNMYRTFNDYDYTESKANFTFRGEIYYPHKREDCEKVFEIIEKEIEIN